jgi:hypothetical protein
LVTLESALAHNKHLIMSINPSEAALPRGVTPHELMLGLASAYEIEQKLQNLKFVYSIKVSHTIRI